MNLLAKVRTAAMDLRRERVTLIKQKVKDVLGKDVDIHVSDINTDVKVSLNTNDVARTAGIELNELTLTDEEVRMLEELNGDEELAAPPSSVEVFGEKVAQRCSVTNVSLKLTTFVRSHSLQIKLFVKLSSLRSRS